jgi:HSP20 family protein
MAATPVAVQRAKEQTSPQQKPASESLLDRVDTAFDEIARRAFQIFEGNGRIFGHDLEDWFKAERELFRPVQIELTDSDESLELKAEVPGFSENELEISVQPSRVVITGKHESTEKEQKKGKTICSEFCSDQLLRIVDLPAEVETDKVTATLKNGVLTLAMPKVAKARSVRVKATAA